MQAYNYSTGAGTTHIYTTQTQGYMPNASTSYGSVPGFTSHGASSYAAVPVHATAVPASCAAPVVVPAFGPVQVPPGYHPIELVQFWRGEHKRGQPLPLHWALFIRTAPSSSPITTASSHAHAHTGSSSGRRHTRRSPARATIQTVHEPRGNIYELVGTPETYTAQFLPHVTFEPDTLPDWRGTHVIGWVHPGQLTLFETTARQVPVWRQRPDWRCQHWVYDVVCAVGACPGVYVMDGLTLGGLQRLMGQLLDAWESGDI